MVWCKVTTMIEKCQASKTWGAGRSRLLLCKQREDAGIEDNECGGDFLDEDDNHDDIDDNGADEGCSQLGEAQLCV